MKASIILTNTLAITALCAEAFVTKPTTVHSFRVPQFTSLKMAEDGVNASGDDAKVCLITGASRGIGKW